VTDLKISLITVVFNAKNTIANCIESVIKQSYSHLEYIVIDGGSTDGTVDIIKQYANHIDIFVSEPDKGIYDAMNKGIAKASGKVIGTLNADDFLVSDNVLSEVARTFSQKNIDILYGNLHFINPSNRVIRKWRAGKYYYGVYNWGWMAPHPTFYCKKELFDKYGLYSLNFGSAADYELMARFMHKNKPEVFYLDMLMVKMLIGGVSNQSLKNRLRASRFDLKAMKKNGIAIPLITVILKPLRKTIQFLQIPGLVIK
jgi:glycosyltransferase involved in cell wall biosynthesis